MFKLLLWAVVVAIWVNYQVNQQTKPSGREYPSQIAKPHQKKTSPEVKQVNVLLNQTALLENQGKYIEALELFNIITEELNNSSALDVQYKAYIWELKANLHMRLWQHVDAMLAMNEAMLLATPQQRKRLLPRAEWLEDVVGKSNEERHLSDKYIASPDVGPSGNLVGNIGVIHLFIEEKSGKSWGLKQRTLSLTAMDKAKSWLAREANKYGKAVNFKHKVFLIDRNPAIKRLAIGGKKMRYQYANSIVKLAVKQLGARTAMEFLRRQKQELNVEQMMLLVHVNKKDRSFAKRCLFRCASVGEYTYILQEAVTKNWQSMEYTQAHEALHLFGADDLYSIKQATYYAPRDIMNYSSKYIAASVIEPITAYAVGLTENRPKTPFKIRIIKY